MRKMFIGWLLGAALVLGPVGAAVGEVVFNDRFPFSQTVFVPCAAGGMGEFLVVSGTLHVQIHETVDGSGGYHFGAMVNAIGLAGVGLETGTLYRATGGNNEINNIGANGSPFSGTFVNNFRLIGTGGGESYQVHQTVHVTVNPNGMVTSSVSNANITCR